MLIKYLKKPYKNKFLNITIFTLVQLITLKRKKKKKVKSSSENYIMALTLNFINKNLM